MTLRSRAWLPSLLSFLLLGACGPAATTVVKDEVTTAFAALPGDVGFHFETSSGGAPWAASQRETEERFCASAFKVFALAEFLKQAEATPPTVNLTDTVVMSDALRSVGGPQAWGTLLTNGETVVLEKALVEMIEHSDNTGTDLVLRAAGAGKVRALVDGFGLSPYTIPDTTRKMMVELLGFDPNAADPGWDAIQARLNGTDTSLWKDPFTAANRMAASPKVLATFYSKTLADGFFAQPASQAKYREILARPSAAAAINPAGAQTFVKGGNLAFGDANVIAIAGGMQKNGRWVYFSALQNWRETDPAKIAEGNAAFVTALTQALAAIAAGLPE